MKIQDVLLSGVSHCKFQYLVGRLLERFFAENIKCYNLSVRILNSEIDFFDFGTACL
jgi:hypothetical protein